MMVFAVAGDFPRSKLPQLWGSFWRARLPLSHTAVQARIAIILSKKFSNGKRSRGEKRTLDRVLPVEGLPYEQPHPVGVLVLLQDFFCELPQSFVYFNASVKPSDCTNSSECLSVRSGTFVVLHSALQEVFLNPIERAPEV